MAPSPHIVADLDRLIRRLRRALARRLGLGEDAVAVWVAERGRQILLAEIRELRGRGFGSLSRDILVRHGRRPLVLRRTSGPGRPHHVMGRRSRALSGLPRAGRRRVDLVVASPLNLRAGNTAATISDITAACRAGVSTGVLNCAAPLLHDLGVVHADYVSTWGAMRADTRPVWVGLGDTVDTGVLLFRSPLALEFLPDRLPDVRADRVCLVVNQFHWLDPGGDDRAPSGRVYDLDRVLANLARFSRGAPAVVVPASPSMSRVIAEQWPSLPMNVSVATWCWGEVAPDVQPVATRTCNPARPVIGRHGRDTVQKWPHLPGDITAAYPDDPAVEVRILGGADVPRRILGALPANWRVSPYADDRSAVSRFLAGLDAYVWFPHPLMVDAHPLSILEAMAHGVPVVTSAAMAEIYGDSVIVCSPGEVRGVVERLCGDAAFRRGRVEAGLRAVREHHSPAARVATLRRLIDD